MNPGIASGSELFERSAVDIREMEHVRDMDGSVIEGRRFGDFELAFFAIQLFRITACDVMPFAPVGRQEANTVISIPVVKALRLCGRAIGLIP